MNTPLENLPPDLIIYQMTFLSPKDVVSLCQSSPRIHKICSDPNYEPYWRNMIENTYGDFPQYNYLIQGETFNYALYRKFLRLLPRDVQMAIYISTDDIEEYIKLIDTLPVNPDLAEYMSYDIHVAQNNKLLLDISDTDITNVETYHGSEIMFRSYPRDSVGVNNLRELPIISKDMAKFFLVVRSIYSDNPDLDRWLREYWDNYKHIN